MQLILTRKVQLFRAVNETRLFYSYQNETDSNKLDLSLL